MIKNDPNKYGSSFHNTVLRSTVNKITKAFGLSADSNNSGEDKVNVEWGGVDENGIGFSIYDWKMYRPIGGDEFIDFHIGGKNKMQTDAVLDELKKLGA